ncbi:DUF1707 SHOCT-like domain-containing protein [Streptomyces aureoverticillatus]|uniref:DUF1707 SHOCT-like domain-containing protein n=1 Tax=Streptomyces aureoverticillatus TaxID=66871 RepID=UPI0013DCDCC6|nr:DUF1707 domain-containing protein [Streptomyces aureoverticillatus]QIB45573.1 DUF1707 domain-containing protein [Streptomyces aureoverticillatus]
MTDAEPTPPPEEPPSSGRDASGPPPAAQQPAAQPPAVRSAPAEPSHAELRASDADRERVAEVLREAVAEGRLDMEEFGERLDAVYQARTYGELAPLTRDLPSAVAPAPKVSMVKRPEDGDSGEIDWAERVVDGEPSSTGAVAIWGGFSRKGGWTVGRLFTSFAMWGGGEIDLREARFAERDVVIRCFALMGGIQVTVPPELDVTVKGFGIMGGFGDDATGAGTPGSPRVVVTGFALMGGVGVERKLRKEVRARLKEERRELQARRREERHALHARRREERRGR